MIGEPEPGAGREPGDVRPAVALPRGDRAVWLFGGALALAGLLLFQALEARRAGVMAPTITAPPESGTGSSALALNIPPEQDDPLRSSPDAEGQAGMAEPYGPPVPFRGYRPRYAGFDGSSLGAAPAADGPADFQEPQRDSASLPDMVAPVGGANSRVSGPQEPIRPTRSDDDEDDDKKRVTAVRFVHPATTVPKGTLIQAVLETAVDSTRGGFARALVSRDVTSFDGSRVLIQRGSRIVGQYRSDVSLAQKRVLIQWQRLTRPDGVTIDLDSPSADPLGGAGTEGKVNSHFFARFAGTILQSTLTIATQLAARSVSRDAVVLALPGSMQQNGPSSGSDISPTITIAPGTSVAVFVARDLDFTDTDK